MTTNTFLNAEFVCICDFIYVMQQITLSGETQAGPQRISIMVKIQYWQVCFYPK